MIGIIGHSKLIIRSYWILRTANLRTKIFSEEQAGCNNSEREQDRRTEAGPTDPPARDQDESSERLDRFTTVPKRYYYA